MHARYDFLDSRQSMYLIAWINALRTVPNLPVHTALESALLLNDRDAHILGHT